MISKTDRVQKKNESATDSVEKTMLPDYGSAPRLLARFIGARWLLMGLAIACGIIAGVCEVLPAWVIWQLVVKLMQDEATAQSFIYAVVFSLCAVVCKAVFFSFSTALAHLIAFGVIADIRIALGRTWMFMPVGALAKMHSSRAKTVALDHCEKLELFIAHALPEAAASITVWLSVTVWLFSLDWRLALATVILVPPAFMTMMHAMRSNGYRMGTWVAANTAMGAAIVDFITALPVIRVFNRVGEEHKRTSDAVRKNAKLQSDWGRAFVAWGAPFSTLVATAIAVIAPAAAWLMSKGDVDAATVLLFLIMGPTYPVPLVTLFYRLVTLPLLSNGAVEIEQQLTAVASDKEVVTAAKQEIGAAEVVFRDVCFEYEPGVLALDHVSFTAPVGKLTAIVGLSGAGKSTIGELITGFYHPSHGEILIGGVDISAMSATTLYDYVAAVFQKPHLLAGTIRKNVVLGKPEASAEQVQNVLMAAAVDRFVDVLPDGLDTELGQGGSGISGGERQRVAIARALLADRPVLVLDEATAATDPDNEALIQKGLAAVSTGRTVIVIAHRLHTVRHADCIHVMNHGRITESGTHEELLAAGGEYAQLWNIQKQ